MKNTVMFYLKIFCSHGLNQRKNRSWNILFFAMKIGIGMKNFVVLEMEFDGITSDTCRNGQLIFDSMLNSKCQKASAFICFISLMHFWKKKLAFFRQNSFTRIILSMQYSAATIAYELPTRPHSSCYSTEHKIVIIFISTAYVQVLPDFCSTQNEEEKSKQQNCKKKRAHMNLQTAVCHVSINVTVSTCHYQL